MKQILEYGKYNVVKCTKCECKFSFEKTDLTEDNKVTCPLCNTVLTPTVE